jgi:hypothetical protein
MSLVEEKLRAIINNKLSVTNAAKELSVTRQTIYTWKARYERFGIDGLVKDWTKLAKCSVAGTDSLLKTQPRQGEVRNEKSFGKHSGVVVVPVVVEPVGVPVPPVAVSVEVTDVEVAVPVAVMYEAPSMPLLIEYSPSCIESGILNALAARAKYLHFLSLHIARCSQP